MGPEPNDHTARRSIAGMPGVVSLMAQLMTTSGVIRNCSADEIVLPVVVVETVAEPCLNSR